MLDMYGIIYVLRLITGASALTPLLPCYTIRRPALSARDESQQPSRHDGAGFVLSGALCRNNVPSVASGRMKVSSGRKVGNAGIADVREIVSLQSNTA